MPKRAHRNPAETGRQAKPRASGLAGCQGPDIEQRVRDIQADRSREEHFQQLFRHYFPSVAYFFVNRNFSKQDAEDLAQDVLLSVYKNIDTFRFKSSFDTWLYRIMINTWKNALRRRDTLEGKTEKVQFDGIAEQVGTGSSVLMFVGAEENSLQKVLSDERTRLLLEAFAQLPPKMRRCVELLFGQGLKYREIADLLGVSITTVKSHLRAARERLRPLLEEHSDVFGAAGSTESPDE